MTDIRLKGLPLVLATFSVVIASYMNVLDSTIAVVALPTIAGNLAATPSQGSWVITSYGVCLAVVLPLSGWITHRFGEVHSFCVAVLLFTATSWLCAAASSFNQLLIFRGLQGLGGGLLIPLSQSLVMRLYPPERQGMALGIWSITTAVAPVLGPVLGGYLTDAMGWPWIFYINVPFGLASAAICWSLLRHHETPTGRDPVDLVGLCLLVVGVICFQLVLDRGHEMDWLASTSIRVMSLVALLCLVFFIVWERDEAHPVVDFSLFRHRNFVIGSTLISAFYLTFVTASIIYPIWMQTVMGYSASLAGLVMSPTSLLPILLMPLIGDRVRRWDRRPLIVLGTAVAGFALYLHAQASTETAAPDIAMSRLIIGLGMPFMWMPLMTLCLLDIPNHKLASATGMFNFMRMAAGSLGTATGVTLWDQRSIFHRSRLIENLADDRPEYHQVMQLLHDRLPDPHSGLAVLDLLVDRQARTLAMDDLFYIGIVIMISIGVIGGLFARGRSAQPELTVAAHD